MFGGQLARPKCIKRIKPDPLIKDIQLASIKPGIYGHFGREPHTDYHVRLLHYSQRLRESHLQYVEEESKRLLGEAITAKYDKHAENKYLQHQIEDRYKEKVVAYEQEIDKRRKKLRELLCQEEKDVILETIETAQKGKDTKLQEMKMKAEMLKAQREAERLKVVEEKRHQQFAESCYEIRPYTIKKNLLESKATQLLQMKENEERKEADRERERMWHDLMLKEKEALATRETQDLLKKRQTQNDVQSVWEKQVRGKQLLKQQTEQQEAEDRIEMIKLQDELRKEEIEALDAKRRKRDQVDKELREQLQVQEGFIRQRKKEEQALDDAFARLAEIEIEKERQKITDTTTVARRETAIYRQYLKELEEERKNEESQLNALLEVYRKAIEKKQDEARCKLKLAKQQLQKTVLQDRAKQLEYKQQEAEQQLKLKEAENELLRMAWDTNERLQAEYDRLQLESAKQYRDELQQQIDRNNERRKLEREQLELELAAGLKEEEKYRRMVVDLMEHPSQSIYRKHPFRQALERCPCPPPCGLNNK